MRGRHSVADVVAKAQAVLSEVELLPAMLLLPADHAAADRMSAGRRYTTEN
jgi:hypothetical protein